MDVLDLSGASGGYSVNLAANTSDPMMLPAGAIGVGVANHVYGGMGSNHLIGDMGANSLTR